MEDIAHAANRVLASRGLPTYEVNAYRRFVGDGVRVLIGRVLPEELRDDATVATCLEAFRADYRRNCSVATRAYPGVPDLLDTLASRGLKVAILSNKPDDLTQLCVRELLPRWRFDAVVGQRDGIPRKPDPAAALEISRSLELPPSVLLFVGDSPVDMETARAAGMLPVGALWGFRSREELVAAGARILLQQPKDLIGLLNRS